MTFLTLDRKKLAEDTLSANSQFGAGRKFIGHDGRECAMVSGSGKLESESFIGVAVRIDGVDKAVARSAIILSRVSRQ